MSLFNLSSHRRARLPAAAFAGLLAVLAVLGQPGSAGAAEFILEGGFFYGPGPIEPDAALPTGRLVNVEFDRHAFDGHTDFANDGSPEARFSDGETLINQNISAGEITLGDGRETVLLAAVGGGPNQGRETYTMDRRYNMIWRVDLALDPGFAEGIIRVDDFVLTTGVVQIPPSLQTAAGNPGGYDRAGSLESGDYLAGRLGDFDQDGNLDGVVVAAPNVPLASNLLPGAPVGNQRGFKTDVELPAHLACELALRGLVNFAEPVAETIASDDIDELTKLLADMDERLRVARDNMERALLVGKWSDQPLKKRGFELTWRVDALQMLVFISESALSGYPHPTGKVPSSVKDATGRLFAQLGGTVEAVAELNAETGDTLPDPAAEESEIRQAWAQPPVQVARVGR